MINFRTKVADSVLDYIDYISKSDIPNNTLSAYRRDLSKFVDFAVSDGIDDITEVDPQFIASFKEHLSDSGLSVSSSSRTLSALRSFFAVLVENNVLDSNPAKAVHNDKSKSRETSILSQKEISNSRNGIAIPAPELTFHNNKKNSHILFIQLLICI